MTPGAFVILTLAAFFAMELVAALMHRFVMHGVLWIWHEDHHIQRGTLFQKNDLFALVFAVPSWLLIMTGMSSGPGNFKTALGLGVLLYGVVYTLVHENIIHRRLPWKLRPGFWYFLALREAHAVHHQKQTREGCENFGMLLVPVHYFRKQYRSAKHRS